MTTTDNLRSGEPAAWLDPAAHLHLLADPTLVAGAAIALVWSAGRGAGMYTVMRERYGAIVAVWWAHATDLPAMAAAVGALADVSADGHHSPRFAPLTCKSTEDQRERGLGFLRGHSGCYACSS